MFAGAPVFCEAVKNVIVADYTNLLTQNYADIEDMLQIDRSVRERIETSESEKVAMQICSRLAKNESEMADMVDSGYYLAEKMSWDVVVKNYLMTSLEKSWHKVRIP